MAPAPDGNRDGGGGNKKKGRMQQVQIERLTIETLGPVRDLDLSLGALNLIYGRNERGKTFVVEFLLRALFRNHGGWTLRDADGRGQVWIRGLHENGPIAFSTTTQEKLEDYWQEVDGDGGLPPRASRLLVVKGADVTLDGTDAGVSKETLKTFVAGFSVLDQIQETVQKTVQEATIVAGEIEGARRGELKERRQTAREKERLDGLFDALEELYSGGSRAALRADLADAEEAIAGLLAAKRHRAYRLSREVAALEAKLAAIPGAELDALQDHLNRHAPLVADITRLETQRSELAAASDDFRWLEAAIPVYRERETAHGAGAHPGWLLGGATGVLLAVVFALFSFYAGVAVALPLGALALGKYVWDLRRMLAQAGSRDEVEALAAEFARRFQQPLTGLPLLLQLRDEKQRAQAAAAALAEQVAQKEAEAAQRAAAIKGQLQALVGAEVPSAAWQDQLQTLRQQVLRWQQALTARQVALAGLNVAAADYQKAPAPVAYEQARLEELQERAQELRVEMAAQEEALASLKQKICEETGDDITLAWEPLIANLRALREEVARAYREQTARILGQMLVCEVVEAMRQQEDERLQQRLATAARHSPLRAITGRYETLRLDGGGLYVGDAYGDFPLGDLSTGAQEQVLLALRLGLASQLFRRQALFLILDDAFQHADWQRRERLVQQLAALVDAGWQVTYFTMDDHVKRLFDRVGQHRFGARYVCVTLDEPLAR
jgi:hypothetical protein